MLLSYSESTSAFRAIDPCSSAITPKLWVADAAKTAAKNPLNAKRPIPALVPIGVSCGRWAPQPRTEEDGQSGEDFMAAAHRPAPHPLVHQLMLFSFNNADTSQHGQTLARAGLRRKSPSKLGLDQTRYA